jgi:hypothetical protein
MAYRSDRPKASCDAMPRIAPREAPSCCFLREPSWFFVYSVLTPRLLAEDDAPKP